MRKLIFGVMFVAACESAETKNLVAAVGIEIGTGPHKGIIQEQQGAKVELVPMSDGTVRAYLMDANNQPQNATASVKMTVSADAYAPTEVMMTPAEGGAYLVGTLPGPAPVKPASVAIAFPSATFQYSAVAFSPSVVAVAPSVDVTVEGVPVGFVAPNGGSVTRVGDNLVEVVIMPKGEVHAYAYTLEAQPIPIAEVDIPEIEIQHLNKPYKVKLKAHPSDPYFVGVIDAKVEIPAKAQVVIAAPQPIRIRGVVYEPARVVFAPLIVAAPIVVVTPGVIIAPTPGVIVAPTPTVEVVTPGIHIVPPRVNVEVGIGVGIGVNHSHKSKKSVKASGNKGYSVGTKSYSTSGNNKSKGSNKSKKGKK
jgi:hypothetical protein